MDQIEGHPIPQDVTGFQFRLIGDMTVKQFAYLAGSLLIGWIIFSLPVIGIVKIPIALIIVLIGVGLAFLPIQGRSADVMLGLFLKTLIKPSGYKLDVKNSQQIPVVKEDKVPSVISPPKPAINPFTPSKVDEKPVLSPMNRPDVKDEVKEEVTDISQEAAKKIEENLERNEKEEKDTGTILSAQESHQRSIALEKKLQQIQNEKEELEKKLIEIEKKMDIQNNKTYVPTVKKETPNVKLVPDNLAKTTGTPIQMDETPNLVSGVVKDPRGGVLPNILIEIKDKNGNPIRALKTNQLGQFKIATPLSNGEYTVEFEDPSGKNNFDKVELKAGGEVIPSLEVISIDEREKLRKQLFG